jgi:hypothetical protein
MDGLHGDDEYGLNRKDSGSSQARRSMTRRASHRFSQLESCLSLSMETKTGQVCVCVCMCVYGCMSLCICTCVCGRMSAILPASRNHLRRCVNGAKEMHGSHCKPARCVGCEESLLTSTRPGWHSSRCEVRDGVSSADRRRNSMQDGESLEVRWRSGSQSMCITNRNCTRSEGRRIAEGSDVSAESFDRITTAALRCQ